MSSARLLDEETNDQRRSRSTAPTRTKRARSEPPPTGDEEKTPEHDVLLVATETHFASVLGAAADPTRAEKMASYHRGAYANVLGLTMPQVDACFTKQVKPAIASWPPDLRRDLALRLMRNTTLEMKELGSRLFGGSVDVSAANLKVLRADVFERGLVTGWAVSDSLCIRPLRAAVSANDGSLGDAVADWGVGATNLWTVRASCVAFVGLARKEERARRWALIAATNALRSVHAQERFVQLGAGWVMRDVGSGDRGAADAFLKKNLSRFSREGLAYAVEKLAAERRAEWVEEWKAARGSAAGVHVTCMRIARAPGR